MANLREMNKKIEDKSINQNQTQNIYGSYNAISLIIIEFLIFA